MTLRRVAPLGIVALMTGAGLAAAVGASAGTLQGSTTTSTTSSATTSTSSASPPSPTSGQSLKLSPARVKPKHDKVTTTMSLKGFGNDLGSICDDVDVFAYPSSGANPTKVGRIGGQPPATSFKKKLTFKIAKGTWTISATQQCGEEDGTLAPLGVAEATLKVI